MTVSSDWRGCEVSRFTFLRGSRRDFTGVGALDRFQVWSNVLHSLVLIVPMPHKHDASRHHHIPKMSFKVQNWPAYEAGLRRRGSLMLWIDDAALKSWKTIVPSGQAWG